MTATARTRAVLRDGRQEIQIPDEFRLPGQEMRIERQGRGVYIEPVEAEPERDRRAELAELWARIDRDFPADFMPNGREQPSMPPIKTWDD